MRMLGRGDDQAPKSHTEGSIFKGELQELVEVVYITKFHMNHILLRIKLVLFLILINQVWVGFVLVNVTHWNECANRDCRTYH